MGSQYKLHYFNLMGRAEPARLLFAAAKVEYEDVRFEREDWPKLKPKMPWGVVPVLEVNGEKISQSDTIYRYIAKKHGLAGETEMEIAKADELVNVIMHDIVPEIRKFFQEQDAAKKEELKKKFIEETLPGYYQKFTTILQKNGTGFLVGKKLTYADVILADNVQRIPTFLKLTDFTAPPELEKHKEMVWGLPGIKEWIAKRPKTDM